MLCDPEHVISHVWPMDVAHALNACVRVWLLGNLSMGTFIWRLSIRIVLADRSHRMFTWERPSAKLWLASFTWDLSLGKFRLRVFAWYPPLENFHLRMIVLGPGSIGYFPLGNFIVNLTLGSSRPLRNWQPHGGPRGIPSNFECVWWSFRWI